MCLYIDDRRTRELKQKFKSNKSITCYKVLNTNCTSNIFGCKYHTGWNYSSRGWQHIELTEEEKESQRINYGIHVFVSQQSAERYRAYYEIIVPVTCYKNDLVSGGKCGHAVFTKVFLKKRNYKPCV